MKHYLENKFFIPKDFFNRITKEKKKKNQKSLLILVLINLYLLPQNINLFYNKSNNNTSDIVTKKIDTNLKKVEEIHKWLELYNENILEYNINNKNGKVNVQNIDNLECIDRDYFSITNVNKQDDYYIVEILMR